MIPLACLAVVILALDGPDPDPAHTALKKLGEACAATDWPAELAARQELIATGDAAVRAIQQELLAGIDDARFRRSCYEILGESFAKDERVVRLLVGALDDPDDAIRYGATFRLGDLKVYAAHRRLRLLMDDAKVSAYLRLVAAKSLAQLGESCGLRLLYDGALADSYMERYMASIGLKALSGKNLDEFEGYRFGEGACVTGGRELMVPLDAVADTERKARRFAAAAAYFRWLKAERPDLYKHLTAIF